MLRTASFIFLSHPLPAEIGEEIAGTDLATIPAYSSVVAAVRDICKRLTLLADLINGVGLGIDEKFQVLVYRTSTWNRAKAIKP